MYKLGPSIQETVEGKILNILYTRTNKSTFRILFGDIGASLLQLQCNGVRILYKE